MEHLSERLKRTWSPVSSPGRWGLPWKARHPRPGCSPVSLRASTVSWRWSFHHSPTPGRDICRSPPARWATGAICRCRCCPSLRNPGPRTSLRGFCVALHWHKSESKFSKVGFIQFPRTDPTETLLLRDRPDLTCETRNPSSFEINQPQKPSSLVLARLNPAAYRTKGRRQSRWCSGRNNLLQLPLCARAVRIFAWQRLSSSKTPGKPCRLQAVSVTHPHTWKSRRGDKNTSLKWFT